MRRSVIDEKAIVLQFANRHIYCQQSHFYHSQKLIVSLKFEFKDTIIHVSVDYFTHVTVQGASYRLWKSERRRAHLCGNNKRAC